jgi:beta-glucanase (GH16 family)
MATWPSWIEYDMVETNSERNGGYCNVHYGEKNTQTGPHNFSGDLSQWHEYGCELTPEHVIFYLDGNPVKQHLSTVDHRGDPSWRSPELIPDRPSRADRGRFAGPHRRGRI